VSLIFNLAFRNSSEFFAGTFPSAFHFYPEWIPLAEKTIMITAVGSGMYLGEIFAFSVSGYLAETRIMWGDLNVGGWPSIFVWFGLLGVLWFPFFVMTVHSTPSEHPTITREELAIIQRGIIKKLK
jgi:ACS family sodium-dependent inorganic phosphate cotransporter-like MFS transporter 6/7/8